MKVKNMFNIYNNKRVLITGGTGSLGSKLAARILQNAEPKKLLILSRDEYKQDNLSRELNDDRVRFFLGDIRDLDRLKYAFNGIDLVIHTAALKQVPALEYNPFEAVKTNIIGTQNVIEAAIYTGVPKVVCISTDKAAFPSSLYGATKLCAEKLFVAANVYSPESTAFSVVRFGNFIGSRGSILEIMAKNKNMKKMMITDPDMTRFFITLEESVNLVGFAIEHMQGGEIFIPHVRSMKISDLFDILAPHVEKEVIGIRPGEKKHEILLSDDESRKAVLFKQHYIILPTFYSPEQKKAYEKYFTYGEKLNTDFIYASNTNNKQLSEHDLKQAMKAMEI